MWRFDPSKAGPSFALGDVGTHPLFIIEAMIPDMKIDNLMCTKRSLSRAVSWRTTPSLS